MEDLFKFLIQFLFRKLYWIIRYLIVLKGGILKGGILNFSVMYYFFENFGG